MYITSTKRLLTFCVLLTIIILAGCAQSNRRSALTSEARRPLVSDDTMRTRFSSDETWVKVMKSIDQKSQTISEQLDAARRTHPELVISFKLVLAYAGFLHNRQQILDRVWYKPSYEPFPWPPRPGPQPILEKPCLLDPLLCKCLAGDSPACREFIGNAEGEDPDWLGGLKDEFAALPNCDELKQSYLDALECLMELLQQDELTSEDVEMLLQCQQDAHYYWSQLVEHGCLHIKPVLMIPKRGL